MSGRRISGENHREFDSKKEALNFLKNHALMSVGWTEKGKKKVAIYWNGKLHIEDASTKKIWGSIVARELVAVAKSLAANSHRMASVESLKGRWLDLLDDISTAIAVHARKQGNRKVLGRLSAPVKEIRALIEELE